MQLPQQTTAAELQFTPTAVLLGWLLLQPLLV
jgi:hypothetical protein